MNTKKSISKNKTEAVRKETNHTTKTSTISSESDALPNKTTPAFLMTIYDEHKYIGVLMKVLAEQLENISSKGTADFDLMFDIMHYMREFPDRFHHPREEVLFLLLKEKDSSLTPTIKNLLNHHEHFGDRGDLILDALNDIIHKFTISKKDALQDLFEDYISVLETHIELEETEILCRAIDLLDESDWQQLKHRTTVVEDPIFGHQVHQRYRRIYDHLAQRIEKAADDFTLMEFVGLGAFFESIEPLSLGISEISDIINSHSKQVYRTNANCYKSLRVSPPNQRTDYIAKPVNCFLDCYDVYVDGLFNIGKVLRKTREKVAEPYSTGFNLLKELEKQ